LGRVTQIGISDQSEYSALKNILPSNQPKAGLGSVGKHTGEIVAAAQWLQGDVGKWVFDSCEKDLEGSFWNMERWETWKTEFGKVSAGEEYDPGSREVARLAVSAMTTLETQ
jgi:hypothetical protein